MQNFSKRMLVCTFALALLAPVAHAHAKKDTVIYSFTGGNDGAGPAAALIADSAGNFYGTTSGGGSSGAGVVFKLAPDGSETVLYSFTGGGDGANPQCTLLMDKHGNLFGTTSAGGTSNLGTVFKLAPDGTETVLHSFAGGGVDGAAPQAGLIADKKGNLYGTTEGGGGGAGTVFRVAPDGATLVIHQFANAPDGAYPTAGLMMDKAGNLYGTTLGGGVESLSCGIGCGTVFELSPAGKGDWAETILYSFSGNEGDGMNPGSNLIQDGSGNVYGTTTNGGNFSLCDFSGCGTVFELSRSGSAWTETVLYVFQGGSDGQTPYAGLVRDKSGTLYGATFEGGYSGNDCNSLSSGCGTVFSLASNGAEKVLHAFKGGTADGMNPQGNLFADSKGNFYGTTVAGAGGGCAFSQGCGTVYKLRK